MPLSADMSPNTLSYTVVDAFAVGPFTGNPAAVIILSTPLSEDLMLKIAASVILWKRTSFPVESSCC
jgi:predicted PhzF superfamily epimerase YddE/YHI9